MISRRKFIALSTAGSAALASTALLLSAPPADRVKKFGFITGIIGKEMETDWKDALRKAASFGYTEIETGGFRGESAESYLRFLKETGLTPVAGGIPFNSSVDELKKTISILTSLEIKIAVTYWPWYSGGPFRVDECRRSAERLNYLGALCKEMGMEFCWHNHDKEFIVMEEGLPFDYLMANTDSTLVKCELDIYWARKGGADAVSVMRQYSGRYNILHIKDMAPGSQMDFECPGSGIIDFREVFREADRQGIKHFMAERDNVPDGIACLKSAAEWFKEVRY